MLINQLCNIILDIGYAYETRLGTSYGNDFDFHTSQQKKRKMHLLSMLPSVDVSVCHAGMAQEGQNDS